jgi:putative ABC transport system ATP-binding protein
MPDERNVIELVNLWKRYKSTELLRGVKLAVEQGQFISIRGKSGMGKTTLLKIIGLLEPYDTGELRLLGRDINGLGDNQKSGIRLKQIGFVFQFFNLIPSLTVSENIELPLALAGIRKRERKQRANELLKYFDLTGLSERFPESLSGGERQRIAVIRALVKNPAIILADEPTSSLDEENSNLLMNLLTAVNRDKKVTLVLTTTDQYEKLPTTRDYLLKDGYIREYMQVPRNEL